MPRWCAACGESTPSVILRATTNRFNSPSMRGGKKKALRWWCFSRRRTRAKSSELWRRLLTPRTSPNKFTYSRPVLLAERGFQNFAQEFLFLRGELSALCRQIENVDGFLAFGVDQSHVNVAALAGQRGTYFIQESGPVLGDHFHQRRMIGGAVVKLDGSPERDFWRLRNSGGQATLQQWFQRLLAVHHIRDALLKARSLAGI